jgi:hypothetical protein
MCLTQTRLEAIIDYLRTEPGLDVDLAHCRDGQLTITWSGDQVKAWLQTYYSKRHQAQVETPNRILV